MATLRQSAAQRSGLGFPFNSPRACGGQRITPSSLEPRESSPVLGCRMPLEGPPRCFPGHPRAGQRFNRFHHSFSRLGHEVALGPSPASGLVSSVAWSFTHSPFSCLRKCKTTRCRVAVRFPMCILWDFSVQLPLPTARTSVFPGHRHWGNVPRGGRCPLQLQEDAPSRGL